MKVREYIGAANVVITKLTFKACTIAEARQEFHDRVTSEEPAVSIPKNCRTKAQIIARLNDLIHWLNCFGRAAPYGTADDYSTIADAHAEALEMDMLYDAEPIAQEDEYLDLDQAHAEALEMEAARKLTARQARFVYHNSHAERAAAIEEAHAEALEMDKAFEQQEIITRAMEQYDLSESEALEMLIHYAHPEALEIDQDINSTLQKMAADIAREPQHTGASCIAALMAIEAVHGVTLEPTMLDGLAVRACK